MRLVFVHAAQDFDVALSLSKRCLKPLFWIGKRVWNRLSDGVLGKLLFTQPNLVAKAGVVDGVSEPLAVRALVFGGCHA